MNNHLSDADADADAASTSSTRLRGWRACREALAGSSLVSDPSLVGLTMGLSNNLLFLEGEHHQALRSLLRPFLGRARLDRAAEQLKATGDALVCALLNETNPELMSGLAEPLVLEGIFSLLQVPEDRRPRLAGLARDMIGLLEPDLPSDVRRRAAGAALRATLHFERDALAGTPTGMHAALEEAARAGIIPAKLARSTPVVLLHGGYENPLNQLGCIIDLALKDLGRFRRAASADPDLLFDEAMRTYSPVRLIARWVAEDVTYAGQSLSKQDLVWVDLGSANFDDRRFPTGRDVDLTRRRGNLGFGHGRHSCPGAALARLEGRVLIGALLRLPEEMLNKLTVQWNEGSVARGPNRIARKS